MGCYKILTHTPYQQVAVMHLKVVCQPPLKKKKGEEPKLLK